MMGDGRCAVDWHGGLGPSDLGLVERLLKLLRLAELLVVEYLLLLLLLMLLLLRLLHGMMLLRLLCLRWLMRM